MSNWQMANVVFKLHGMTCSGCENAVRTTLHKLPGVESASVDLKSGSATVEYDPARIEPQAMIVAVGGLGYTAELEQSA